MSVLSKILGALEPAYLKQENIASKKNYDTGKLGKKARYSSMEGRTRNETVKEAIEAIENTVWL